MVVRVGLVLPLVVPGLLRQTLRHLRLSPVLPVNTRGLALREYRQGPGLPLPLPQRGGAGGPRTGG